MKTIKKIIKKSKYLNFCAIVFCLAVSTMITRVAIATGWELPTNPGDSLIESLDVAILNLTNWFLGFTVVVSVLALIWGGLNYVSSSGDAQKAELAKKIIYYALIGVVVAGVSYAIVNIIVTEIL
jgi:hypothetical protein